MVVVDDDPTPQHHDVLTVAVAVKVERDLIRPFAEVIEAMRVRPAVNHELCNPCAHPMPKRCRRVR
jgi:hypothetical protein